MLYIKLILYPFTSSWPIFSFALPSWRLAWIHLCSTCPWSTPLSTLTPLCSAGNGSPPSSYQPAPADSTCVPTGINWRGSCRRLLPMTRHRILLCMGRIVALAETCRLECPRLSVLLDSPSSTIRLPSSRSRNPTIWVPLNSNLIYLFNLWGCSMFWDRDGIFLGRTGRPTHWPTASSSGGLSPPEYTHSSSTTAPNYYNMSE